MVSSVTARPRNSPRARRPGWRAMKRRTPFSVGSSSAPIMHAERRGSSRNAAANGAASRARRRRSATPSRARSSGTGKRRHCAASVTSGGTFAPVRRALCLLVAALARRLRRRRAPGRGRARRGRSGSRSSTRRSRAPAHRRERRAASCASATRTSETLRNVAVTVETQADGAQRRRDRVRPAATRWRGPAGRRPARVGARRGPGGRRHRLREHLARPGRSRRREKRADLEAGGDQGRHVLGRLPRGARAHRQGPRRRAADERQLPRGISTSPSPPGWAGTARSCAASKPGVCLD